jgi:hypothetical protein
MKTIKTFQSLTLKSGESIPKGTVLEFVRHGEVVSCGIFYLNGRELKMRYRSVIKEPSFNCLQKWSDDGICKSVFGAKVEPDGFGTMGEPSWLLASGMI